MLPSPPIVFPKFEPDQLLTSENLNQLFNFLDEQGRLTRTNLIGIGIVCGLEIQIDAATPSITITKGTGVTSKGYLVSLDKAKYEEYISYDAVQPEYYSRFVAAKTQKFPLWELKTKAAVPDAKKLDNTFLEDKLVLIFVELLEENNKNCNPDSCDDKGISVTVTFRPLLVSKNDAGALVSGSGWSSQVNTDVKIPELLMRRFDVPNSKAVTTSDIFKAYVNILSPSFLKHIEKILTETHVRFTQLLLPEFAANPFKGLAKKFEFLHDGSIDSTQLIHIQYYYDLFSDICQAYKEFRKTASDIIGLCTPDDMFPRHLLLGVASNSGKAGPAHRHNFIYSPLFQKPHFSSHLKSLFKRLASLAEKFKIPDTSTGKKSKNQVDSKLRITPSRFGDVPLSEKSIPYYYNVISPDPLFTVWNYRAHQLNVANRTLSWHASEYNNEDDYVMHPLLYDLEPYNFLRIEGHIGKSYVHVLQNIKKQIQQYRLPINVVALSTDVYKPLKILSSANLRNSAVITNRAQPELMEMMCQFQDLESLYESIKNEVLCILCKELKYYYDFKMAALDARSKDDTGNISNNATSATPDPSQVWLFEQCSKGYMVRPGTFGFYFEKVYRAVGEDTELTVQNIAEALGLEDLIKNISTGNSLQQTGLLGYLVTMFDIPMGIIRLGSSFTANLSNFDQEEYCRLHRAVVAKAESIKFLFNIFTRTKENTDDTQTVEEKPGSVPSADAAVAEKPATDPSHGRKLKPPAVTTERAENLTAALAITSGSLQSNALVTIMRSILMIEDLLDHLDVLIYNCKCSALKAIRAEYQKRLAYVTLLRQFGYFTKLHRGLEHKAGVPAGGTFLIVYHVPENEIREIEEKTEVEKVTAVLKGRVRDSSGAALPGALVKIENSNKSVTTNAEGIFTITTSFLPVTLTVTFAGFSDFSVLIKSVSDKNLDIVIGEESEEETENPLNNIAEGTVIADFYLPYLCFSECPPIQYIVPEIKEDDTRSISLEPNKQTNDNNYCSNDERNYKFTLVPDDCDVQPQDGVNQNDKEFTFNPTAVDLQGKDSVTINFIGSKDGINSSPLVVSVYQNPVADFDIVRDPGRPGLIRFVNNSKFATDYTWDFGDDTPADNSKDPAHEYTLDGEYTAKLFVKNTIDSCASPAEKQVPIKLQPEQEVPKCLPLQGVISDFNDLGKVDPGNFSIFREQFKELKDVEAFFKILPSAINQPADKQVDFFAQQDIVLRLQKWLASLFSIISGDNLQSRLTALELYRILVNLVMYIACFQSEDVNAAKISMSNVLELILSHMRIFRRLVLNFTDKEKAILTRLREEITKELERLENSDEVNAKPAYAGFLKRIIEMLKAMNV